MDYRVEIAVSQLRLDLTLARPSQTEQLAKLVGMSRSGFRSLFKRETGVSIGKWLKQRRLESARELLCTQHLSVKEVMVAVGCHDPSHFVRDFASTYGLSPSKYRKLHFVRKPDESMLANKGTMPPIQRC